MRLTESQKQLIKTQSIAFGIILIIILITDAMFFFVPRHDLINPVTLRGWSKICYRWNGLWFSILKTEIFDTAGEARSATCK